MKAGLLFDGSFSLAGRFRAVGGAIADIVYPKTCLACGVFVQNAGGLCPSCWGRMTFIEPPFCPVLGVPFAHDMGEGALSPAAIAAPPVFEKARAAVLFGEQARLLVHRLKYKDRADLALPMARWMVRGADTLIDEAELVVPVPLHRRRLFARRYNQSAELSRAIARLAGLPHAVDILWRTKPTRQQVGLSALARQTNVSGAFSVPDARKPALFGRRVLLIDDVYTTGATLNAASRALLRGGAASVAVLTFARVSEPDHPA